MIMAELHGKLSEGSSYLERREDILTSNVFQSIKYLESRFGLIPILNSVFSDNKISLQLDQDENWSVEYFFWPEGIERKREPDLLIYLKSKIENYVIVIEAKYRSGPSNLEEIADETEKAYGNQLSDQFIDLLKRRYKIAGRKINFECPLGNCYLLYLTMNSTKPKYDIESSIEQFQKNNPNSKIAIKDHLLWTNWTKIWSVLSSKPIESFQQILIRNDLLALLEQKGFKEFTGFCFREWEKQFRSFYKEIWFCHDSKSYYGKNAQFYYELWFQGVKETFFQKLYRNPKFFGEVN